MARMSEVDYANRIYKCTILIDKIESRRIDEKQLIEYIEHLLIEKSIHNSKYWDIHTMNCLIIMIVQFILV
jgi:hypothetical protein